MDTSGGREPQSPPPRSPATATRSSSSAGGVVSVTAKGYRHASTEPICDLPRAAMRGVHDLHSRRARGRLHRPDIRHRATLQAPMSAQIRPAGQEKPQVSEASARQAADHVTSQVKAGDVPGVSASGRQRSPASPPRSSRSTQCTRSMTPRRSSSAGAPTTSCRSRPTCRPWPAACGPRSLGAPAGRAGPWSCGAGGCG